jgi:hypothetical protein
MNVNPFSYLMNKISQKVSKSGDIMTGNLNIQTGGECYVKAKNTVKETEAYLDVTATGEHGLWSSGYNDGTYHASGKWIIKRDTNNEVLVNGTKIPSNGGTAALRYSGSYSMFGTVNKTYYGASQVIIPLPFANTYTINITRVNVGYGNSDVEISSYNVSPNANSIRIEIPNSPDYSGYMAYIQLTLS